MQAKSSNAVKAHQTFPSSVPDPQPVQPQSPAEHSEQSAIIEETSNKSRKSKNCNNIKHELRRSSQQDGTIGRALANIERTSKK